MYDKLHLNFLRVGSNLTFFEKSETLLKRLETRLSVKVTGQQVTRGSLFWPRKVFEGVHSHVMDLLRKTDFGPLSMSTKLMITC